MSSISIEELVGSYYLSDTVESLKDSSGLAFRVYWLDQASAKKNGNRFKYRTAIPLVEGVVRLKGLSGYAVEGEQPIAGSYVEISQFERSNERAFIVLGDSSRLVLHLAEKLTADIEKHDTIVGYIRVNTFFGVQLNNHKIFQEPF